MKPYIHKFFLYLLLFFTLNLIVNALFKSSLHVGTAFSVALGMSLGITYSVYRSSRKKKLL
ncbi:hypothetical protein A8F94_22345 [Bacillus sp. FJAT-27225]|nr:hypothetical protein A8F94_22345 [Bacillus sp. FJAT-27225]